MLILIGNKWLFISFAMSYGPTNPRPYSDIIRHPYWRKQSHQSYLTNAIQRKQSKTSKDIRSLSKYFVSTDSCKCQKATKNGTRDTYGSYSSRAIFTDPKVLPYYISSKEQSDFNPTQRSQFTAVLSRYVNARTGRIPTIYRITDFTYCDDLGRIYHRDEQDRYGRLKFAQYTMSAGGKFRNGLWIRGYSGDVFLPAYIAVGYAGYDPDIQQKLYSSLKFDIHHVGENLFSVTPDTLLPLPSWMHLRWVHGADYDRQQNELFKYDPSKQLW